MQIFPSAAASHSRLALAGDRFIKSGWTAVTGIYVVALLAMLTIGLWRTPFAISETIGVLENLRIYSWTFLLKGDDKFVRPLFWFVLGLVWKSAPSVDAALVAFKLLHVASVALLVALFVRVVRPSALREHVALTISLSALIGTSAFRDNLESLPLNHMIWITIATVYAYSLLERPWRRRNDVMAVLVAVAAVAAKEPGIVVPLMLGVGVWAGSPGVSRRTGSFIAVAALAYVGLRMFAVPTEVAEPIGWGFHDLAPAEVTIRFEGAYWLVYLYNGMAGFGNVLLGEPTRGIFAWTHHLISGTLAPWQVVQAVAYLGGGGVIAWWIFQQGDEADPEGRRLLVIGLAVIVATALISFNYVRDRNVAAATVLYALILHRAAAAWFARLSVSRLLPCMAGVALFATLAGAWQLRTAGTLYYVHDTAWENRKEWLVDFDKRTRDYADRPSYIALLNDLHRQGVDPSIPGATPPRWLTGLLDYKW